MAKWSIRLSKLFDAPFPTARYLATLNDAQWVQRHSTELDLAIALEGARLAALPFAQDLFLQETHVAGRAHHQLQLVVV